MSMAPDQLSPCLSMGQAFQLSSIRLILLGSLSRPSVSRQSPNLGEKRESGTAGSMFSVTYIKVNSY